LVALWLRLVALGYALVGVVRLLIVRFIGFLIIVDNINLIDSIVFYSYKP
jgi:hypothetical protein